MNVKNWYNSKPRQWKLKLVFALIVANIMLFTLNISMVNAQVTPPVFTNINALDLAGSVTDGEILNIAGQDFYRATTTKAISGCTGTRRIGPMQWFGSSFTYTGGGGATSCVLGGLFYATSTALSINLLSGVDGYYCIIAGTSTPLLESSLHNQLCVLLDSGEAEIYDPQNLRGNFIPPPISNIDYTTRFLDAVASGTASTSISMNVDYFLETSEYTASTRPDFISVITLADGFFNDQQVANDRRLILPLTDGEHTKNIPMQYLVESGGFLDGNYYSYINFFNINTDAIVFSQSNLIVSFEISGGIVVNSSVAYIADGLENSLNFEYQDCSITNVYGCFVNALIFVFIPQSDSLNVFSDVYDDIKNKPPFGYYTATLDLLTLSTTTAEFDFGNIPFQNEIFTPIKTGLASIIIFGYIFFFSGRLFKFNI